MSSQLTWSSHAKSHFSDHDSNKRSQKIRSDPQKWQAGVSVVSLDWKHALLTGLADAVIWVWFIMTAYTGTFTDQLVGNSLFGSPAEPSGISVATVLVVSAVLVALRWDSVPRAYRVTMSLGCCASIALLLVSARLDAGGAGEAFLGTFSLVLFTVCYYGSQILRIETIAKCRDLSTMVVALLISFVSYYVVSGILILLPDAALNVYAVLAPLVLLFRSGEPLAAANEKRRLSWRKLADLAGVMLLAFGIAGGLITAAGGVASPRDFTELFSIPSPVYLAMVLAYMALIILVAAGHELPAATYFALMSAVWMVGSLLGALIHSLLPNVPPIVYTVFAAVVALAIIASFAMFRGLWLKLPSSSASDAAGQEMLARRVDEVAAQCGLTPREDEVLRLLASGRSLPYVQQMLCISEGTARTHIKHIYAKLGVHSKQEMLDLVQGENSEKAR
jgi:DNA-binding CsgD family transcriptional regulator